MILYENRAVIITVILSNFRKTRTVLHSISLYQTQTIPNYFFYKTRVRGVESLIEFLIKSLSFVQHGL
jgi:hypothetical protein